MITFTKINQNITKEAFRFESFFVFLLLWLPFFWLFSLYTQTIFL